MPTTPVAKFATPSSRTAAFSYCRVSVSEMVENHRHEDHTYGFVGQWERFSEARTSDTRLLAFLFASESIFSDGSIPMTCAFNRLDSPAE